MSRLRNGCLIAAAAVIGVSAVAAWALWPSPPPRYETSEVDRGKIVAKVSATGTLSATVTVEVGAQVSGRILSLDADFNSDVTRGQVIARLDPEFYEASLAQAQANATAARANAAKARVQVKEARRQFERASKLAEQGGVADAERDAAESAFEAAEATERAAEAAVDQAEASLKLAEVNLAYTEIHSPIDGTVISRDVDVGQSVAASLAAPTLFVIAEDLRKMQVDTSVSESDVGRLQPGKPATFTVDAWPGREFTGVIRQIRKSPTTVQNVVTYDAVVDVDNADLALLPGMTANVTFVWDERDEVLRVPNAALRFRPPDAKPQRAKGPSRPVYRLEGGVPVPVLITTGLTDGTNTEVTAIGPDGAPAAPELKPGDLLVTDAPDAKPGGGSQGGGNNAFRRGF